jgi:hypothetical protein
MISNRGADQKMPEYFLYNCSTSSYNALVLFKGLWVAYLHTLTNDHGHIGYTT